MFEELAAHGEVENLNVCDNLADHMVGNVYAKFRDEEAAAKALATLQGRFYNGRPIVAEFSPVTDFREATCRQYEENTCNRGGYCNFMHLKPIGKDLKKVLLLLLLHGFMDRLDRLAMCLVTRRSCLGGTSPASAAALAAPGALSPALSLDHEAHAA